MKTQGAGIPRVTAYRILGSQEPEGDPILVLTTEAGDHHFVLDRPFFLKLAASCEKAGRKAK